MKRRGVLTGEARGLAYLDCLLGGALTTMVRSLQKVLKIALIVGLTACGAPPPSGTQTGAVAGPVRIASDATFAPFHYVDANGDVSGFDIELARQLASRSGLRHDVVVVPYDRLFDDLLSGRHDVVAATTGITPEREEKYLFSAPYFRTCQAVLVRGGAGEPTNIAELAGRRVGAAGAGTSVAALDRLPDSMPVLLSQREATEATILDDGRVPVLEQREIDALIVDEFDAVQAARLSDGRLRVLETPVALEQYGFVFSQENGDLKQRFDHALAEMRRDGSLAQLEREFGLDRGSNWPVRLPQ